ncbi:hypothetical protein KM043_011304 [Ampulex compressa]|nr:hypothetical protein KM043_011304 [Ampulex compressa]
MIGNQSWYCTWKTTASRGALGLPSKEDSLTTFELSSSCFHLHHPMLNARLFAVHSAFPTSRKNRAAIREFRCTMFLKSGTENVSAR